MTVNDQEFRRTLARFAAGVVVVAAEDPATGLHRGMTATAFLSVSLHPPLVLVSVAQKAATHELLLRASGYGISLLRADQEQVARHFAGLASDGRGGMPGLSAQGGAPVLDDCLASLTTRTVAAHPAGDHTLFVGEVLGVRRDGPGDALVHYEGVFSRVAPAGPPIPGVLDLGFGGLSSRWG